MKIIKFIILILVVCAGAAFFIFQQNSKDSEFVDPTANMSPLEKSIYGFKADVDKFKEPLFVTKLFVKKKDGEANKAFVKNLFDSENDSLKGFVPIMPKDFWSCLLKNQEKDNAAGKLLFRILRADEEKMALEMYNVWADEESFKANAKACGNEKLRAVGVGTSVSHRQQSGRSVFNRKVLILKSGTTKKHFFKYKF